MADKTVDWLSYKDVSHDLDLRITSVRPSISSASSPIEHQEQAVTDVAGLIGLSFYSATNSNGTLLTPSITTAISRTVPWRGSIVGVTVDTTANVTGDYEVRLNGTATSVEASLRASSHTQELTAKGATPVAAGDLVTVVASGCSGTAQVFVTVYLYVEATGIL